MYYYINYILYIIFGGIHSKSIFVMTCCAMWTNIFLSNLFLPRLRKTQYYCCRVDEITQPNRRRHRRPQSVHHKLLAPGRCPRGFAPQWVRYIMHVIYLILYYHIRWCFALWVYKLYSKNGHSFVEKPCANYII